MPDEEWIKTLEDGRKVKFIYQELPEDVEAVTTRQMTPPPARHLSCFERRDYDKLATKGWCHASNQESKQR
jgi:hypothetical protein